MPILASLLLAALAHAAPEPRKKAIDYRHPSGYAFAHPETWSVRPETHDQSSDGVLIGLPEDPAKKDFAGISVQRFRVPYRKAGSGTWKNAADYIKGLRKDMGKINDALRGASGQDAYRMSAPEGLPARFKDHPGASVLKDGSRNVIIAIDRKKDFLVLTYEASLPAYARHWPDFLSFLDGFWVDKR